MFSNVVDDDVIKIQERVQTDGIGEYSGIIREVPFSSISRISQNVLQDYLSSETTLYGPPPMFTGILLTSLCHQYSFHLNLYFHSSERGYPFVYAVMFDQYVAVATKLTWRTLAAGDRLSMSLDDKKKFMSVIVAGFILDSSTRYRLPDSEKSSRWKVRVLILPTHLMSLTWRV